MPGEETNLGTIELCENKIVGETSFRITGDGFTNKLFNVVSNKNMQATNMGMYYPSGDFTMAIVSDVTDEIYMFSIFPGKTTGVRNQVDEVSVTITRKMGNTTIYYWGGITATNSDIQLNITRCGNEIVASYPRNTTLISPFGRNLSLLKQEGKNSSTPMTDVLQKHILRTGDPSLALTRAQTNTQDDG